MQNTENESFTNRLKSFIKYQNMEILQFEKEVGLTRGVLYNAIRDGKTVGSDKLTKIIVKYPDLNLLWLLSGEGDMIKEINNKSLTLLNDSKLPATTYREYDIPIIGQAMAGYLVGNRDDEQLEYIAICQLPMYMDRLERGFMVHGDSMMPLLSNDDAVLCRRIMDQEKEVFRRESIYVVVCADTICVKHLKKQAESFTLISANSRFGNYDVPYWEVLELWKVEAVIHRLY